MIASPVIFALDYPTLREARAGAELVAPAVGLLKVGLELFVEAGAGAVALGAETGRPVFLDLKLHDIPETVERAVARAAGLGVKMLTVHAAGGPRMLERAVARAEKEGTGLEILAVTVLTSLDAADLAATGISASPAAHVVALARMASKVGVRGFVCSPEEVALLRQELGKDAILVTPGVRPASGAPGDQKRVATPAAAIAAGASWLVVGRPIRDAADPRAAAEAISAEARTAVSALAAKGGVR